MADYDGSVRIKYDADTKSANKAQDDFSQKAKRSLDDVIDRVENLRRAKKALVDAGAPKDAEVYQHTAQELEKWEGELSKLSAEQKGAAESANYFKREIEKYQEVLKTLEGQGKYFGDEEYDQAYASLSRLKDMINAYKQEVEVSTDSTGRFSAQIAELKTQIASMEREGMGLGDEEYDQALIELQNLIDKRKEYQQTLMSQTDKAKEFQVQKELEAQQRLQEAEEQRKQKEEARINEVLQKEEQKRAKEASSIAAQEQEENRLRAIKESSTAVDYEIIQLTEQRKRLIQEIKQLESAGVGYGYQEYDRKQAELASTEEKLRQYAGQIKDTAIESQKGFKRISNASKNMARNVNKSVDKSKNFLEMFTKRIMNLAKRVFVFSIISRSFNSMVTGIKEGFKNLAKYSSDYNKAMSALKSQTAQVQNSLAAAFAPIVTAILPYLTMMVNGINTACNAISRFIALISGKKSYAVAKKQVIDYANSLDSAKKAAKSALAAFDDLNVLNQNATPGSGEITGAGAFEEVPLTEADFSWMDNLLMKFQPVIDAIGRLKDALQPLKDFSSQALKDFYDSFLLPVGNWVLGEGLPRLIDGLTSMIKNIDWEKLNGSLERLWGALAPFDVHVGEGLLWFWEYVLIPIGTWTMNELVPAFLDLLTAGIDALNSIIEDLEPLWNWLWTEFLEPAAKWTGQKIIDGIKWLTEKLRAFSEWCRSDDDDVELMKSIILGLFAGIMLYYGTKKIVSVIGAIKNALAMFGLKALTVAGEVGLTILAIGLLAAGVIYLSKNWNKLDTMQKAITIFGAIAAAAMACAVAMAIFHTTWSVGIAAAAIVGGLTLLGLTAACLKWNGKKADESTASQFYNSNDFGSNPLPAFATGGITTGPTVGMIGEAGREAVLPLENNTGWMDDLADKLAARMPAAAPGPIYLQIDGRTFAQLEIPYFKSENTRRGMNFKVT